MRGRRTLGGCLYAGITLRAESTGSVLLLCRSELVPSSGQWSCPGGSIEPGEEALDAALREFNEEAGPFPPGGIELIAEHRSGLFTNFL